VTGQTNTPYYYAVGKVAICCGYDFQQRDGVVDWGDQPSDGVIIPPPKNVGIVVGRHQYRKAGVYNITWTATALCVNKPNATYYDETWLDSVAGTGQAFIFNSPSAVKTIDCIPSTFLVGIRTICTVTLNAAASPGGTLVRLMSDNTSAVQMSASTIVPSGSVNKTFRIKGLMIGSPNIYASAGEGTLTQAKQIMIN
jgi:hypothetical protein